MLARALTLIEIVVVIALMAVMTTMGVLGMRELLDIQQGAAIRELAQTYRALMEEAALRNVTFRFVFDLDRGTWKVEAGDPRALIFSDPEERERYDRELEDKMSRFTQREIEEGAAAEIEDATGRFAGLDAPLFTTEQVLAQGLRITQVWTPQYGDDGIVPSDEPPEEGVPGATAYTHIFPNGTAEQALIRIEDDAGDGFTLHVEPLTGNIQVTDEILDADDLLEWVPRTGPELP